MKVCLRRYGPPIAVIASLYLLNRFWLVPRTAGLLHRLLAWHFADFLAGGLMLCVLDCALELSGRPPVRQAASALGFSFLCGTFWELVTPLYLPRSVGDWRDVLAVCLGGLTMFFMLNIRKKP
ncbi:MAG: hypothetical protein EGQ09_09705 [Clostridiales bacterium]|nr:hypothetical protein [Clostridiales bacterium]